MIFDEWLRRIWYLINRRQLEQELRDEMEAHREAMSEPRHFGNTLRLQEESRDAWGWKWLDDFAQDLRYACRTLRFSPGFVLSASLILCLGIGGNLAAFEFLDSIFWKPLPFREPATLVEVCTGNDRSYVHIGRRESLKSLPNRNSRFSRHLR